jgi:hypothetical protein
MRAFATYAQARFVIYRFFSTHNKARSLLVAPPAANCREAPILKELVIILIAHGFLLDLLRPDRTDQTGFQDWHAMTGRRMESANISFTGF